VPGDDRLSRAIGTTLLEAFPQAWRWRALRFNELMLGFDEPVSREELVARVADAPPEVASLVPLFQADVAPVEADGEALTDDRAPVEWLTDRMIVDFVSRGGELDETPLPTDPNR
jgi:hypothetical protein